MEARPRGDSQSVGSVRRLFVNPFAVGDPDRSTASKRPTQGGAVKLTAHDDSVDGVQGHERRGIIPSGLRMKISWWARAGIVVEVEVGYDVTLEREDEEVVAVRSRVEPRSHVLSVSVRWFLWHKISAKVRPPRVLSRHPWRGACVSHTWQSRLSLMFIWITWAIKVMHIRAA